MFFEKKFGNYKKYESLKENDFSVNIKYWKKYKGISKDLSNEIPKEKLCEIIDNYTGWIIGDSYDEEMHLKLQQLPEIIKNTYLIYNYECEINNGGFDQFYFNSIGYEVFEIQKALDYFGLPESKKILDESIELLQQKIDIKDYFELSKKRELPTEDLGEEFSKLDSEFYKYPENIEEIICLHLDQHRDELITIGV